MIGSPLYVTASHPEVMQEVGQVARFQEAPKEAHIIAIKRTLQYVKGTIEYDLWYPKGNNLIIHAFIDADWARSGDDHESTLEALEYLHQKLGILPSSHYIFLIQNIKEEWKCVQVRWTVACQGQWKCV